jgi:hypothetical protein
VQPGRTDLADIGEVEIKFSKQPRSRQLSISLGLNHWVLTHLPEAIDVGDPVLVDLRLRGLGAIERLTEELQQPKMMVSES